MNFETKVDFPECHIDRELQQLRKYALHRYNNGVTHDLKELIEIQKMIISSDLGMCMEKVHRAGYVITNPMDKVIHEEIDHIPITVEAVFDHLMGCNSHIIPSANRKVINGLLEVENV